MDYVNLGVRSRKTGIKLKPNLPRDEFSMENVSDFFADDTSELSTQQQQQQQQQYVQNFSNATNMQQQFYPQQFYLQKFFTNDQQHQQLQRNQNVHAMPFSSRALNSEQISSSLYVSEGRRRQSNYKKKRSSTLSLPPFDLSVDGDTSTQHVLPSTSDILQQQKKRSFTKRDRTFHNNTQTQLASNRTFNDDSVEPLDQPFPENSNSPNYKDSEVQIEPFQAGYGVSNDQQNSVQLTPIQGREPSEGHPSFEVYKSNLSGFINDSIRDEPTNGLVDIEAIVDDEEDDEVGSVNEDPELDDDYNDDQDNDVEEVTDLDDEEDVNYTDQRSRLHNVSLEPIQENSEENESSESDTEALFDGTKDLINNMDLTRGTSFEQDTQNGNMSSDDEYIASQAVANDSPNFQSSGLRRSSRIKVPTLDYWRNEKIVYKRETDKPGLSIEAIVRKDPAEEVDEEEILRKKKEEKRKQKNSNYSYNPSGKRRGRPRKKKEINSDILEKLDRGEVKTGEWIKFGILETSVKTATGLSKEEIVAFAPDTAQKEDTEENEDNMYSLSIIFDTYKEHFQTGMYKLPPEVGKKKETSSESFVFNCFVVQGILEVCLNSKSFICTQGSTFQVPANNKYSFENKGEDEVRLYFVQIAMPGMTSEVHNNSEQQMFLQDSSNYNNSNPSLKNNKSYTINETDEPQLFLNEDSFRQNSGNTGTMRKQASHSLSSSIGQPSSFSDMVLD
ncbi:hypothetical protein ACO0RG_001900 [Hanseniaspora osmophila]|uniref:Protein MIF2 n=1 Tax=Hanseniaspora osmophila TaxID=56408 RepID=A0A1E5RHQ2_9ASCO|nr:Protein MIF2 [Hanseniaspora osmophila]